MTLLTYGLGLRPGAEAGNIESINVTIEQDQINVHLEPDLKQVLELDNIIITLEPDLKQVLEDEDLTVET